MTTDQQVREHVSRAYAKVVSTPAHGSGPCCAPVQKGVAAKLAG